MSIQQRIPFVDLEAQYRSLRPQLLEAFEKVMGDRAFIQGRHAEAFADEFCRLHGIANGVGCSNGTTAIELALEVLGVGPGDEVITVANTFFATVEAICRVGATPVLADADPRTYQIDPAKAEAAIGPRTRVLMPVHLYGVPSDMDALSALARKHDLLLVEDAAQAHLARWRGQPVGTSADAVTFSFYPGKNLGAYGDAGLVAFREPAHRMAAAKLLDHGRSGHYEHGLIGHNYRMDGLQAAFLSVKLPHLPRWIERRRANAARYDARLRPAGFQVIDVPAPAFAVYHLYVIQVSNRDALRQALRDAGIESGIHYPVPLNRQPALAGLELARRAMPASERAADRILSLPMYAELTEEQIARVCDVVVSVGRP